MLWCSYFKSFIKSINFDRYGNFIKKFNFVSTPMKIIIPIAHHCKDMSLGVMQGSPSVVVSENY